MPIPVHAGEGLLNELIAAPPETGPHLCFAVNAETTDRQIVLGTNGRFYTIPVDRLPSGRGHGEPLRLMIDLPNEHDIVAMFPYRPDMEPLVAAGDRRGFVVDGEEAVAQMRAGKQVLTPGEGALARVCVQAEGGDAVALVGDNRQMLIVRLDDIPLMTRGRGVILQRYKSCSLADAKVFRLADGLSWRSGENRSRTETNLGRGAARAALPAASFRAASRARPLRLIDHTPLRAVEDPQLCTCVYQQREGERVVVQPQ